MKLLPKFNFSQTISIFFMFLIIFLPFGHLLWYYFLSVSGFDLPEFPYLHFYDLVIVVLSLVAFIKYLLNFNRKSFLDWRFFSICLMALGLISIFFISPSWRQGVEGFRFTLLSIALLFSASVFGQACDLKKMIRIYLWVAFVVALWALIERLFPLNYWQLIIPNIENSYGTFLVGSSNIQRSASFLLGANQLGSYLLPTFFLSISDIIENRSKKLPVLFSVVFFLAIFFSFSRAALLGLLLSLFIFLYVRLGQKVRRILISFAVLLALVVTLIGLFPNNKLSQLVTHGESQIGHNQALTETLVELKARTAHGWPIIVGGGIGTAGPIAIKYGGLIPESWYLQLVLELGILGFVLWLVVFGLISKNLIVSKQFGLFFGLLSLMITALFLHTFADNLVLVYTMFILIGVASSQRKLIQTDKEEQPRYLSTGSRPDGNNQGTIIS
ncbi:MAG: hypothetical protein WCG48_01525 [Candidatus Berkelbacteria bacterium]